MAQDDNLPTKPETLATPVTPGADSRPAKNNEDALVEQIEREDSLASADKQFDDERLPDQPTHVVANQKRSRLHFLKTRTFWFWAIGALLVALIFAWLITPSRDWLLNTVGQRATMTIGTTVATTQGVPPVLKNATVTINGQQFHTDDHGNLRIQQLYGDKHIVVSKQGYATITKDVTVDFDPFFYKFGGKQLDDAARNLNFSLTSVGIALQFTLKDWLTGNPVTFGAVGVGDVETQPDTHGVVNLTVPATDSKTAQLTAKFGKTYADITIDFALDKPTGQTVTIVPAGKDYFISKRTGQFGVYSANLDGSGQTEVIASNTFETGDIAFSASPSGKFGVLASVRDATHDAFGSVQQKLFLVDLSTNKLTPLDQALRFNLIDWSGDTLVYVASAHDQSGATVQRVASLNAAAATQTTLANAPTVAVARVSLKSAVYLTGTRDLRVVQVGGGTDKIIGQNVQQVTQPSATAFAYQTTDGAWHQYDVNADQVSNIQTPASTSRAFVGYGSADGQTQLVVDTLDGTLTLIAKNAGDGTETKLYTGNDLTHPVKWVQNVIVYHAGSADYAVAPSGGTPKKITDTETLQPEPHDYFDFN